MRSENRNGLTFHIPMFSGLLYAVRDSMPSVVWSFYE